MIEKLEDEYKGQWPRHLSKLTHAYNSTRCAITSYLPHFLMFGWWPRLPIDFVFPTHEVMGTLRPVDSYVADLITALRKAFEVAQNMTQTEALRQKRRYDQKTPTVTLNKGDVVLVRNDQFVGKRKRPLGWQGIHCVQPSWHWCACVRHWKSVRSKVNPSPKLTLPNQKSWS